MSSKRKKAAKSRSAPAPKVNVAAPQQSSSAHPTSTSPRSKQKVSRRWIGQLVIAVITAAIPIAYTKVQSDKAQRREDLREQKAELKAKKEKSLNRIMNLDCAPAADGHNEIRILTPTGFAMHAGKMYFPAHPDPGLGLNVVRHGETILDVAPLLRHLEAELSQILARALAKSSNRTPHRVNVEIPVVGRFRYYAMGTVVCASDHYTLNCLAKWDATASPPLVRLTLLGMGRRARLENIKNSFDTVTALWLEECKKFEDRIQGT